MSVDKRKREQLMELLEESGKAREEMERVETIEEFRQLAAKNGIDFSESEAEELISSLGRTTVSGNGELSEDELENVSGGSMSVIALPLMLSAARRLMRGRIRGSGGGHRF